MRSNYAWCSCSLSCESIDELAWDLDSWGKSTMAHKNNGCYGAPKVKFTVIVVSTSTGSLLRDTADNATVEQRPWQPGPAADVH